MRRTIVLNVCFTFIFLIIFLPACRHKKQADASQGAAPADALFTLLSPEQTGIAFQNTLEEGPNTNVLVYEYFYNGGGVATGDFNGDGFVDIYFTANMSENRLYLNRGAMRFYDATTLSGAAGRGGPWKTGVSVADVNGDNRLDIYLSYSGMLPEPKRANQLFINMGADAQGVPHFEDKAVEYGLANAGFSNQSYFFDYDRDGDLDMLLLNHNPKSLPVLNEIQNAEMIRQDDPFQGLRLYQNNGANTPFTDITRKAGIRGSALTYGLGLGISDVNGDGWPDFYVSNDYAAPDYLYINNKNGTFTDQIGQSMGHNSQFSMGNDVADINNDALPDIVTLDMLPEDNKRQKLLLGADNYDKFNLNVRSGFHHQYMRNMLQLNNGDGTFSEIGQLAGVSNTDWSWAALLADYDNDGWKDLFISNGYFRDYTNLDFIHFMDNFVKEKGRLNREDVLELVKKMPASNVTNYLFANRGGLSFDNKTHAWGMARPSNSNGAAYADLDNDGDLDLVVNNINQAAFVYRNEARKNTGKHYLQLQLQGEGMNTQGIGATIALSAQGNRQQLEQYCSRGYLSAVSPVLHFGLGAASQADTLLIRWPDGRQQMLTQVAADQRLTLSQANASKAPMPNASNQPLLRPQSSPVAYRQAPLQIRDFNRQPLLIHQLSFCGPRMAKGDVNGDGQDDLAVSGANGQGIALFLQKNARFSLQNTAAFEADKDKTDADLALFDADADGDLDLYAAAGGYNQYEAEDPALQDRLYINDGKGSFSRGELPEVRGSKACIAVGDANADGAPDLFVGGRVAPGRYPEAPVSYLLINDGKGHFTDQTEALAPGLRRAGMFTDAVWADLDADGRQELATVGEWMPIAVYGMQNGKIADRTADFFERSYAGWWNALEVADLNGDQKPDLIAGNHGLNSQCKASEAEPAELYFRDFDGNGSVEPIFCFYIQGKSYPYITRDELGLQLPRMKAKFNTFESYAGATLNDLFSAEDIKKAEVLRANYMETSLFLNQNGKFAPQNLPVQAQYAPVCAIAVADFTHDGTPDILLCGNESRAKLRLGKYDANYGVLLSGDGKGGFRYIPQTRSGLQLKGDVRSVLSFGDTWLFGVNQGDIVSYRLF